MYDKTFDPKVFHGHCDVISWSSEFALYLDTQMVYFHFFQIMNEYDQTFDPIVLIGQHDLISRFSDFALYLGTHLEYVHASFTLGARPLNLRTVMVQ